MMGTVEEKLRNQYCMYKVHSTSLSIVNKSHSDEVRHKSSCPLITNGVGQHIALRNVDLGGRKYFHFNLFWT